MKFSLLPVALTFIISLSANAATISFNSGLSDDCFGWTLSDREHTSSWVTGDEFNAAAGTTDTVWIQDSSAWDQENVTYLISESDLNQSGTEMTVTSLLVAGDGNLEIIVGNEIIWSSWYLVDFYKDTLIDVIAEIGGAITIGPNQSLDFLVYNLDGPTGLIYAGTASSVPEVPVPAAAWLFASALIGLAGLKRK